MWVTQSDEDILNYLVGTARRQDHRDWLDEWSPKLALRQQQLDFLCASGAGDIVVKAVGPNQFGESGDIIVVITCTESRREGGESRDQYIPVPQGESALAGLRQTVWGNLSQCGQTHWGAEDDVKHLSAKLNIGFLIFRDTLDSEDKQCLVNYHASRGDFPYWMSRWWSEPLHFKLASVQLTRGSTPRCVFLASEVPAPLKTHWTICCPRAPFGEVATGPPEFS
jgi:hypothetical protein